MIGVSWQSLISDAALRSTTPAKEQHMFFQYVRRIHFWSKVAENHHLWLCSSMALSHRSASANHTPRAKKTGKTNKVAEAL
jgi:hypothetical protein